MNMDSPKGLCALAFSGGLDTSWCVSWLQSQGYAVATLTIDTGGFDNAETARIAALSKQLGAVAHHHVDARAELWQDWLRYLLYGNVLRGQMYPLSVSAERVCQARRLALLANEIGAQAIAHGSTGAGNDQVRFDVAFRALCPELTLITPIRQLAISREQELADLAARGIEVPARAKRYSVNEGMWGTSVGGQETHDSWQHLPDDAWPGGMVDPNLPARSLQIAFERGTPVAIDDQPGDPVALIEQLNQLGRRFGIGRGIHLGDTILGIKGRVGFEAPAAHLLIAAHRELEKLVLSGKQLFWKESLGALYGSLVHEGHAFDPLARDLEALLLSSQRSVSGEVRLLLRPHSFEVQGVRSPCSLMQSRIASYGEGAKAWTGEEAAGYAKIFGIGQQVALAAQAVEGRAEG
jgi:argininosuccinate synthase